MIITALMAPYFALMEKITAWAADVGVDRRDASGYVASMFGALSAMAAELEDGDLGRLITESMTPGGLNELALNVIRQNNGFDNIRQALKPCKTGLGRSHLY